MTNKIELNISTYSSEKLCEIIVCDRYFKSYKDLSIKCMKELAKRRDDGDEFDFECYIEKSLSEMPKFDFSTPDLGNILRQFTKKITKG